MCQQCYEDYGSPTMRSPEIEAAARLVNCLYGNFGASTGGNLHIVTDDWNLEDRSLASCRDVVTRFLAGEPQPWEPKDTKEQLELEAAILDLMEPMTEKERASVLGLCPELEDVEEASPAAGPIYLFTGISIRGEA